MSICVFFIYDYTRLHNTIILDTLKDKSYFLTELLIDRSFILRRIDGDVMETSPKLINNKYRIVRRIGGGSFGEIFLGITPERERVGNHV